MQITNASVRFKNDPIEVDESLFFQMITRKFQEGQDRSQQQQQRSQ
jgi:hypothetical protein